MNTALQYSPSPTEQLQGLLRVLNMPTAWVAIGVFLLLMVVLGLRPKLKWFVLSMLIYVASLGFFFKPWFQTHFITPLELVRNNGRAISVVLMFVLLVPVLQSQKGWRQRLFLGGTILFFVFELLYAGRSVAGGLYTRGFGSLLIYVLAFVVIGIGVSQWLQDWDDVYRAVACMAMAGVIFSLATVIQLAFNPSGIIWQHRLAATGSTATLTAELIVLVLLPTCVLIVHPRTGHSAKIFWTAMAGLLVVFLIWTGTRNGLLMIVVGLSLIFRRRLKQMAWVVIGVTIFFIIAASIYQNSMITADRLLSFDDNRTQAWISVLEKFWAHPIVGDIGDASVVENSYISTAANMGLVGVVPLTLVFILISGSLVRLHRVRGLLGQEAIIADLVVGALSAIAVGALFDGYLLAVLNAPVICVYIYLAIAAFLLDWSRLAVVEGDGLVYAWAEDGDWKPHDYAYRP